MLINKKITVLFIIFLAVIFLLPDTVLAQATDVFGTNDLADAGINLGTRDLKETIAGIVNIFLGFLGILATLIILYGGFIWMTSGGNAEKVDKAKRILINGIIGLVIVLSSYAIARFILREGYGGVFGTGSGTGGPGFSAGVGLGAGALDSHYPARYAKDVARNTNIYLTFKEPMNVSTIVADTSCGGVNCEANIGFINLYEQGSATPISGSDLVINYSTDPLTGFRTFQINPYGSTANNLGDNTADVRYRMELGDLLTQNDTAAFPYSNSYAWIFTTGTEFDFTPPTIISVRPLAGSVDNPMNSVIQINFSEAINPSTVTGEEDGSGSFIHIVATTATNPATPLSGKYKISNQYRTVELETNNFCGVNSCGGDVFCLPASEDISVSVKHTVLDMSDNALDSNGNGTGGENPDDWYDWSFTTNSDIDLVPPTISSMQVSSNVSLVDPIEITFDKSLMGSSINSSNIDLVGTGPVNYWMSLKTNVLSGDTISINHDRLDPSSYYTPTITSGIKDLRQNCWFPSICDDPTGTSCVSNTDFSPTCTSGTSCVGS